jgi:beta-galactosidase
LSAVESYVFWNYHYPTLESWSAKTPDYTERGNVTLFLELAAKADLFVIWRIGPYICAEWPGGGYPDWLKTLGAHTRTATQPYQNLTYTWMHEHIEHVRPFFAENGGPIIMTQVKKL